MKNQITMYTKTINDRQAFSQCLSIEMPNGVWISNPTEEQIAEAGWEVYVPPVVEPQPQTEPEYGDIVEAVKKMLASSTADLSDEEALEVAALYPTWAGKSGEKVNAGERLWYDGKLYKVVQTHTVQDDWTPDVSASLYTEVSIEEWPEWVQPTGVHDAYNIGDKVTFNGLHYVSLINANVYSPTAYPAGWEEK